ncbi:MAG: hypothetical protein JWN75_617 [Candidatus Saccharibacteria bacterium]|nr:hypothetical protein [Candidatus Saccharibacteria bacterium]
MYYYEVAPTQIIRPNSSVFTYAYSTQLEIGQIVTIEVGRKQLVGVVFKRVERPSYETKQINSIIEAKPLPTALINLAQWLSDYYVTHMALVLQTILPRGIQKARRARPEIEKKALRNRTKIVFNKEQSSAIQEVTDTSPGTVLLHGITGSGKTAVYIELANQQIKSGRSVIVLVPEIALTSQVVDEFEAHFGDVILTHSRQTEAERHLAWRDALTSDLPRIVIGPRSALFMPLKNIGLVVIDEAHEPSFKQEQSPRYSALRAASVLVTQHAAKLVLGSATPSMSDYFMAKASDRPIIEMTSTARQSTPPTITLVDMTKKPLFKRHRFLSDILIGQLEQTFTSGNQALVFHNRRGSASTTLCENCGWQATCSRCFVPLTLHADHHELRCHICGNHEKVPTSCPVCQHTNIIHKGIGTKLIESELRKIFPNIRIGRFDGDSDADQSVDALYKQLYDGSIDLIIGTQVIAKGLDLPHLRTVGVIQADAGLSLPDYAASERTFQLLAQVVGRVGRSDHATTVVIQSYQPTHPAVVDGLSQDYAAFYDKTIAERKRATFPPFTFLLKLTCIYKTEAAAIRNAQAVARTLRQKVSSNVEILGPTPAFYERQRDTYRWQLVLKSKKRTELVKALQELPPTHWQFELDPISLL